MEELKAVALTHKNTPLDQIGLFHLSDEDRIDRLTQLKAEFNLTELMYLSTCNRVELVFSYSGYFCFGQASKLFAALAGNNEVSGSTLQNLEVHNGQESLEHLIRVASSLDSMVIGEREIITQVRKSYEEAASNNLSGDLLRLAIRKTIETAKRIYTETQIATRPVSIVSLAWQKFQQTAVAQDDGILLIGAGQMIRNFSRFLKKAGYTNISIYNRSLDKANSLAYDLGGQGFSLSDLKEHQNQFKTIVTCTGSTEVILDLETYKNITQNDSNRRVIIDMALPADTDVQISASHEVQFYGMKELQEEANKNIAARSKEIDKCEGIVQESIASFEKIYRQRILELAMRSIPDRVKEIKDIALNEVFAKDLEKLDDAGREVLEKVIMYMEKKYISVPMKMAREVMIDGIPQIKTH